MPPLLSFNTASLLEHFLAGLLALMRLKSRSGAQSSVKRLKCKRDLETVFGRWDIHHRCGLPMHRVPRLVHGPRRHLHHSPPAPPAVGTGWTSQSLLLPVSIAAHGSVTAVTDWRVYCLLSS
jgi:hypothetical protein